MNLFFLTLKLKTNSSSEQGLTLLEVIASIVLISVILVAVAPPLLLSTATRVKMRRVSQAQSIAQDEVNRVQGIMARSRDENLPTDEDGNFVGLPDVTNVDDLDDVAAPDSDSNLREVDVNGDGDADFLVQTFRDQGADFTQGNASGEPAIFRMGVRVYSILAEDDLEAGNLETDRISLQMTTGLKDQNTQPMAVLVAEVARSDMERSLDAYQDYVQ